MKEARQAKMPELKGNGLILPDGTLNHLADNVLKKQAAGTLMGEFGVKPGDLKK
jgi:hypothetical protein